MNYKNQQKHLTLNTGNIDKLRINVVLVRLCQISTYLKPSHITYKYLYLSYKVGRERTSNPQRLRRTYYQSAMRSVMLYST